MCELCAWLLFGSKRVVGVHWLRGRAVRQQVGVHGVRLVLAGDLHQQRQRGVRVHRVQPWAILDCSSGHQLLLRVRCRLVQQRPVEHAVHAVP